MSGFCIPAPHLVILPSMDFTELNRISSGFIRSRILQVGVKLGIFDLIEGGCTSSTQVAEAIGADGRAMTLFLNALASMKLLRKDGEQFHNTEISTTFLVKDSSKYFGDMVLFEESLWDLWEKLGESVRTGRPAKYPDMFQSVEEDTEKFISAMHSLVMARGDADLLSNMLDLNWAETMIDIGSGPGTYPIHFLKKYPHLKITIFDLPGTLRVTKRFLEKEGMAGRVGTVEGDYNRDELPSGFDIAFLSNIIHSEDEEANRRLMSKVYYALRKEGEIIIKDHILDDNLTSPEAAAVFSIQMLLATRGRVYSFKEVRAWLEEAGFGEVACIALPPPLTSSLVRARK